MISSLIIKLQKIKLHGKDKRRVMSQEKKTESLEIDPHTCKQLIFGTLTNMISGERIVSILDVEIFQ